jgi:hypothetical protein
MGRREKNCGWEELLTSRAFNQYTLEERRIDRGRC